MSHRHSQRWMPSKPSPQHDCLHKAALFTRPLRSGVPLADTAALVRADVGVKAVLLDHSNWDHHVNLGTSDYGYFKRLTDDLAASLAAFFQDLGDAAARVTVVTLSEFGRRLQENGSGGLDHGYGGAMLVLGAGIRGGASTSLVAGRDSPPERSLMATWLSSVTTAVFCRSRSRPGSRYPRQVCSRASHPSR